MTIWKNNKSLCALFLLVPLPGLGLAFHLFLRKPLRRLVHRLLSKIALAVGDVDCPNEPLSAVPKNRRGLKPSSRRKKIKFHGSLTGRILCSSFRKAILESIGTHIRKTDNVLAIGFDKEVVSSIAAAAADGKVISLEIGPETGQQLTNSTGNSQTLSSSSRNNVVGVVEDPWNVLALLDYGIDFDLVYIDMGALSGRDPLLDAVSLLHQYWYVFQHLRLIIAKSTALQTLARRLVDASFAIPNPNMFAAMDVEDGVIASGAIASNSTPQPELEQQKHVVGRRRMDGKQEKHIPWDRLPFAQPYKVIVCAVGVRDYRATIPTVVREGDKVIEIGCQHGNTIRLIRQRNRTGIVYGADIGPSSIERARKLHDRAAATIATTSAAAAVATTVTSATSHHHRSSPSSNENAGDGIDDEKDDAAPTDLSPLGPITYIVLDAWNLDALAKLNITFDVIYLDLSGISGRNSLQDSISLIMSYFHLLPSLRCVVVKSRSLRDLSGRLWSL